MSKMKAEIMIVVFAASVFSMGAFAHHNPAAHYIVDERMEIEGVVTEFRAVNPHARVYFEVTNQTGQVEEWMAEGDSIINLRRAGWTNDQLKTGRPHSHTRAPFPARPQPG